MTQTKLWFDIEIEARLLLGAGCLTVSATHDGKVYKWGSVVL